MHEQEKVYQLALSLIKGIGFNTWKRIIEKFKTAQAIFQASKTLLTGNLPGIPLSIIQAILAKDTLSVAEKIVGTHQKNGIQVLSFFDESYPLRLKHIATPPSFLFWQGNMNFSMSKVISIVGTRKATTYGKSFIEKFIADLRAYDDILVVSGLAYGIDIHVHKMCLCYGLPTIGVLAGGLDKIYPAVHKKAAIEMLAHGGLVSEIPIGSTLETFQFPQRNRIIAGLADATIVVEADYKSGAVITANFANDYNREVFAVPGNIDATYSAGCNYLIRTQQAHLLTNVEDLAYIMNWQKSSWQNKPILFEDKSFTELSQEEQRIVQILKNSQKEVYIDEISQQIQLFPSQVSSILLQLELKNIVECLPGNKFKLVAF